MEVKIINPDEVKDLFRHWGEFAKVCYDTKTNKPENIGKHCLNSGHYSGSRTRYIEFQIEGVSRSLVDQLVRSEQGCVKNVQSFRYVGKDTFMYDIPLEIIDNEDLLHEYHLFMKNTMNMYSKIQNYVLGKTNKKERANEQARYVLPMSTLTAVAIGFTPEALIHLMNKRMCVRAEDKIRSLAFVMRDETLKLLPELKDLLVPDCQKLLYCPEGKSSCGAYPKKEEVKEILSKYKEIVKK